MSRLNAALWLQLANELTDAMADLPWWRIVSRARLHNARRVAVRNAFISALARSPQ